ncbi:hypothetical protein AX774_g7733, partial [Zancudomyces culisetae]
MSVSEISDSANITAISIVDAVDDDSVENFVVPRPTPSDLVMYPKLQKALPTVEQDFFWTPLADVERKEFYAAIPRNSGMDYEPSEENIKLSGDNKRTDAMLYDIQYRLSAVTRPLDYFMHEAIRDGGAVSAEKLAVFINSIRVLLADVASNITQQRIKLSYKASGVPSDP